MRGCSLLVAHHEQGASLTDHAPMEQLDASPEAEDERGAERQHDPTNRQRLRRLPRYGRNHGVPHALGGVGERVEQRQNLEPLDRAE